MRTYVEKQVVTGPQASPIPMKRKTKILLEDRELRILKTKLASWRTFCHFNGDFFWYWLSALGFRF